MTDMSEWIKERRRIREHALTPDERADTEDAYPTLLTAVEKVLELHKPEEYEDPEGTFFCRTCGDWNMCEDPMGEQPDYPCLTVRAIEGAINEQ